MENGPKEGTFSTTAEEDTGQGWTLKRDTPARLSHLSPVPPNDVGQRLYLQAPSTI
jgi:hypothetical protein